MAHILLVEDHDDSLRAMSRLLEHADHEVTCASTVAQARSLCARRKFDLLVCDIGLPDGDGWELGALARECGIPGVAVTGYGYAADVARSREAGFAEHLTKPVSAGQLLDAVEQATRPALVNLSPPPAGMSEARARGTPADPES